MDIESARCECCNLKEDCTQFYIDEVKSNFGGKWLCGLCSESVKDEVKRDNKNIEEAVRGHMSFCGNFKCNPAVRVADGMKQMLRRRSGELIMSSSSSSSSKKYSRSISAKLW